MSVIVGINCFHAGASAAVLVDGQPRAAMAEERLNRVKYFANFPTQAVKKCLEMAGLSWKDVDAVAVGRDTSANLAKKVEYALTNPSQLLNLLKLKSKTKHFSDFKNLVALECDLDPQALRFAVYNVEHHLAHTASAFYMSDWDRAAGITVDGSGDFVSCLLSDCVDGEIRPLKRVYVPDSLGSIYTTVCHFIGYGKYGDEGKVMGLAPLGKDTYADFFKEMVKLTTGGFQLNPEYFLPFGSDQGMEINDRGEMILHPQYSNLFRKVLGEPRAPYSDLPDRDKDLAFGLQHIFEVVYMHLLNTLHKLAPQERLAMAGGCVLNSVANGKLFDQTPFRQTCIQPAAGDDGLALGAALYVSNVVLKEGKRWVMKDAYLGPEYSDERIRADLEKHGVKYRTLDREQLLRETVEQVAAGKVVGWFQGRMEWGPRALGNRSILAHPGLPDMKDVLNARIKHRESFRPFAPSVLVERQADIFEHTHPSPFMLHVYKIRPEWRAKLCAVNHVDNTGRLQTVSREENPLYYDLIRKFDEKTGIPVILNTSFNENEPIVCTPDEAIHCYRRTKMDVLVIGSHFCAKEA